MSDVWRCPHCGNVLETESFEIGGTVCEFPAEECGCDGARAERRRWADKEAREAERKAANRAKRCNVPRRFAFAKSEFAKTVADKAAAGKGTYIVGPVGTGKTHIACAALLKHGAINVGKTGWFLTVTELLNSIRNDFGKESRSISADLAKDADLLVLDDLGKERYTPWALECIFDIVNSRYNSMKPIIVTTQYMPSELAARMAADGDADTAQAIISRLRSECGMLRTSGDDMRKPR